MPCYPIIEQIDTGLAPAGAFELFKDDRFCFFLDSGMDPHKLGRYSFIGSDPFAVFRSRGNKITLTQKGQAEEICGNPFYELNHLLNIYRLDSGSLPVPFSAGAVGYFSYDLCHFIERLPTTTVDDLEFPECYFGFYDLVL
ncbi:MAG: aminodeoxychorismate synthase, component I, partial [Dehalococcoidia bacterium]|nr:aminodeoxychorismate synthase, component I [Dehalococcoidia bacterium]